MHLFTPALQPAPPIFEAPAPSLVPPSYCTVRACDQPEGCAVAEGYHRLDPASIDLGARKQCHWAKVRGVDAHMCTHDPARDSQVSAYLHSRGSWIAAEELEAYLQVACSKSRPFMLDVGSNIGSYAVPAAALGCYVVAFDPAVENLGRVVESMRRNGALDRATFYQNFVGAVHSHRTYQTNSENMGGTTFLRGGGTEGGGGSNASFVVRAGNAHALLAQPFPRAPHARTLPRTPCHPRPLYPARCWTISSPCRPAP